MCYLVYCVIGVRFRDYFVRIGREIENKYELLKGNEWDQKIILLLNVYNCVRIKKKKEIDKVFGCVY